MAKSSTPAPLERSAARVSGVARRDHLRCPFREARDKLARPLQQTPRTHPYVSRCPTRRGPSRRPRARLLPREGNGRGSKRLSSSPPDGGPSDASTSGNDRDAHSWAPAFPPKHPATNTAPRDTAARNTLRRQRRREPLPPRTLAPNDVYRSLFTAGPGEKTLLPAARGAKSWQTITSREPMIARNEAPLARARARSLRATPRV
jgi:hypothetical protein